MKNYDFIVYAEGGHNRDLGKSAVAYIVLDGEDKHIVNSVSQTIAGVNDVQAHLVAVGKAVRSLPNNCSALVYSDSTYAVGLYGGEFKKVKANKEYRDAFLKMVKMKNIRLSLEWHGIKLNDPLTRLCWQGCSTEVGEDFAEYYARTRTNKG